MFILITVENRGKPDSLTQYNPNWSSIQTFQTLTVISFLVTCWVTQIYMIFLVISQYSRQFLNK